MIIFSSYILMNLSSSSLRSIFATISKFRDVLLAEQWKHHMHILTQIKCKNDEVIKLDEQQMNYFQLLICYLKRSVASSSSLCNLIINDTLLGLIWFSGHSTVYSSLQAPADSFVLFCSRLYMKDDQAKTVFHFSQYVPTSAVHNWVNKHVGNKVYGCATI